MREIKKNVCFKTKHLAIMCGKLSHWISTIVRQKLVVTTITQ
jgi:hypothetical protein